VLPGFGQSKHLLVMPEEELPALVDVIPPIPPAVTELVSPVVWLPPLAVLAPPPPEDPLTLRAEHAATPHPITGARSIA
jgi:hypothetical protein